MRPSDGYFYLTGGMSLPCLCDGVSVTFLYERYGRESGWRGTVVGFMSGMIPGFVFLGCWNWTMDWRCRQPFKVYWSQGNLTTD